MKKYFVSFCVEYSNIGFDNIIIDSEEIKSQDDIESLENLIAWKLYGDDRIVKIINFKELQ